MKKGIALALLGALGACTVVVREPVHEADGIYGDDVYVVDAAPAPRTEVIVGPAPGPNYVWVNGYWGRYRNNWYWVKGRWAARPRPQAVWVSGRWDHQPRGYRWSHGHWR